MQNSHVLCVIAMFFYAAEISVTDHQLKGIHPRFLTLLYSGGVFVLTLIWLIQSRPEVQMPTAKQWTFVVLMVGASVIAAHAHFQALHKDAGAVTLTMYYCLLPVVATLIDVAVKQELPEWRTILGWVLGVAALYCVTSGGNK